MAAGLSAMRIVLLLWCLIATRVSAEAEADLGRLDRSLESLGRQLMQLQMHIEESKRVGGSSGIKAQRSNFIGNRPYASGTYSDRSLCGLHAHANNIHTMGMGEFVAILNGVEFRTRHNDYTLAMKSTSTKEYGAMEKIDMPPVPPEVTSKETVREQIEEMREWFKAWATQNSTHRDYSPYFRPVLCYLEGMWTVSPDDTIEESFSSDRHQLDAHSWRDMHDKARFCSETGHKSQKENYAVLPSAIVRMNGSKPVTAQWNYRIACHPLKDDLPLNRFRVVNDLQTRLRTKLGSNMRDFKLHRNARFQLNSDDSDEWGVESTRQWRLVDELMSQVAGLDNYGAELHDVAFGMTAGDYFNPKKPLNAAYYNRWYRRLSNDANGVDIDARGFKDENLYMALTTQDHVISNELEDCPTPSRCEFMSQKWSYAIPLEVVYTTPLAKWNPLEIVYKGEQGTPEAGSVERDADGAKRTGANDPLLAYNGTHSKIYYITPAGFFDNEVDRDPADTAADSLCVLDGSGQVQEVKPSGHRLFIPNIPGVGTLRQRYPIMPLYQEGSTVMKEVEALKDVIFNPTAFPMVTEDPTGESPYYQPDGQFDSSRDIMAELEAGVVSPQVFRMTQSTDDPYNPHIHFVRLSAEDMRSVYAYNDTSVETTVSNGHSHQLVLMRVDRTLGDGTEKVLFLTRKCDNTFRCQDGHSRRIYEV